MSYQLLIVEDEPLVAKRLKRLAGDILAAKLKGTATAQSVEEANTCLKATDTDLILLDLNLAGEDGFELLQRFTAKAPYTIVVSAQTERALEAFEYGVLDFVAKPFTRARLEKALKRLWQRPGAREPHAKQLSFETHHGGLDVVSLNDILFFKGADKYSEAVLKNGDVKFHGKPLNRLEYILSTDFVRTHKSYLVHQGAIRDVKSLEGSRYELYLNNGDPLPVGRTRVDHVRQLLETRASEAV